MMGGGTLKILVKKGAKVAIGLVWVQSTIRIVAENYFRFVALKGRSMEPTIQEGDFALCIRKKVKDLKKGDIVLLRNPLDRKMFMAKRITGLPGEIKPFKGSVVTVPRGHMWLEGDNASLSLDSTAFGPVPQGLVEGQMKYKIYPISAAGQLI